MPQSFTLSSHNPPQPSSCDFKCGTHKYSVLFSQINLISEHNPDRDYVSFTVQTQTTQIHNCVQVFMKKQILKETYWLAGEKINKYIQIEDDIQRNVGVKERRESSFVIDDCDLPSTRGFLSFWRKANPVYFSFNPSMEPLLPKPLHHKLKVLTNWLLSTLTRRGLTVTTHHVIIQINDTDSWLKQNKTKKKPKTLLTSVTPSGF